MKDEQPHKLPMNSVIDEMLVNQGKRLIVIHHEVTIWETDGEYYLYIFANLCSYHLTTETIKEAFNDYFNGRK